MNFLFTCGGTAGHINPAIGVAGRLRQLFPDAGILFVGAAGMMETELVPREGYAIETVTITNLRRSLSPKAIAHNLGTMKNVVASTAAAKRIIRDFQPDVAVGTGGYVCYPVLKAAHSLGVPTLVHESNAMPGLTTKLLSGLVDCVMVGFEEAKGNYKPGTNVVFTGTPVRTAFQNTDKASAKRALGLPADKPLVLSVWGSLGSDYMNETIVDFIRLAAESERFSFIHSAGKRGYPALKAKLDAQRMAYGKRGMDVREYIYDMPAVMTAADLILCRSGASTLSELSALGRPSILIPSPNVTNNHQEKNARVLERLGASEVLLEGQFDAKSLYDEVCRLLGDTERLAAMAAASKSAGHADAAGKITELILTYAGE